jgi:hypothetical protein
MNGHVQDDQGRALPDVPVQLVRYEYWPDGDKRLGTAGDTTTDAHGVYRLKDVEPGQYIVRAGGVPERNGIPLPSPSRYGVVYYPDKSTSNAASIVEVRAGAEVSGINFTVAEPRLYRVRGRVVHEETRQSEAHATILADFSDLMTFWPRYGDRGGPATTETGTFEILLPSGEHTIGAQVYGHPCDSLRGFSVMDGPPVLGAAGSTSLLVGNAEIDDVVIFVRKTVCLTGSVSSEGGSVAGNRVSFYLRTPDKRMRLYTFVRDDGKFWVDGLLPGEYRLFDLRVPNGSYLKEAKLGNVDILNRTFSVTRSTEGRLDLVLSSKVGQIEGTVIGGDSKPEKEVTVVLVPERARDRIDLYRAALTDDRGRFTLSGVAPGDYKVFSWRSIEQYSWFDPEIVERHERQGKSLRVEESSKETLTLSVIASDGPTR